MATNNRRKLLQKEEENAITIMKIKEETWENVGKNIKILETTQPELTLIRDKSELQEIIRQEQYVEAWLNNDYTEKEIKQTIKQLKNNKEHGSDGIQEKQ